LSAELATRREVESKWRDLERYIKDVIEVAERLHSMGVRGLFGMSLKPIIDKLKEELHYVRRRLGNPDAIMTNIQFIATHLYDLASANLRTALAKGHLKSWGLSYMASCAYDAQKRVFSCVLYSADLDLKPIGSFEVASPSESPTDPEAALNVLMEVGRRDAALKVVTRDHHHLLINPRTYDVVDLTEEVEELLKELKRKLRVRF
jgi:hypothetical protein